MTMDGFKRKYIFRTENKWFYGACDAIDKLYLDTKREILLHMSNTETSIYPIGNSQDSLFDWFFLLLHLHNLEVSPPPLLETLAYIIDTSFYDL